MYTRASSKKIVQLNLNFEDFTKICRLCCKKGRRLTQIFHETEDEANFDETADNIPTMLSKMGLNVMSTKFVVCLVAFVKIQNL